MLKNPSATSSLHHHRGPVAVALSGGIDSAAAATMLKETGQEVFGIHMLIPNDKVESVCDRARKTAKKIDIPFYTLDVAEAFRKQILGNFIEEYLNGRTPNPCIICNEHIKFGILLDYALSLGAQALATGHYARLDWNENSNRYVLYRGMDNRKEQSYFLSRLGQPQLARAIFPLGLLTKDFIKSHYGHEFRETAVSESQEICFISKDYRELLSEHLPPDFSAAGDMVDTNGKVLGSHNGIFNFTIGQRRGIGLPHAVPFYVLGLDHKKRQVIIGTKEELCRAECSVDHINWVSRPGLSGQVNAITKIRYNHQGVLSEIIPSGPDKAVVRFHSPQKAVTPGQTAVFYDGEMLIGGGFIVRH